MDKKYYVIESETNEFREMTDDEMVEGVGDNLELEEDEVEFLYGSCGDIDAIIAYREGDEVRLGIIHDDKLLVGQNLNSSSVTALLNLFERHHNNNMMNNR